MMGTLFCKECGQILRSLVYYIYVVIFMLFMASQMGGSEGIEQMQEPEPGQEYYGLGYSMNPEDIMEHAVENLFEETYRNRYNTYPFGFIKVVTLNEEELGKVKAELEACTGNSFEELVERYVDYWENADTGNSYEEYRRVQMEWHIPLRMDYTYEEFEGMMERVTEVVGKGCMYESSYKVSATKELDYEDAMSDYLDLREKDRVTGAAMRLFCDYAGIILAVLPIFIGVSACMRDKRAKAAEVIYAKPTSGAVLILSRYLANVFMLFVPVVVCAWLMQMPYYYKAVQLKMAADSMAFFAYSFVWLLPGIMITLAVAFLLTELTDNIFTIPVQLAWGLGSIFSGDTLRGNFQWKLVARWNEFGGYSRYAAEKQQLYLNRGFYALLAIVCVGATIFVYEKKRKEGVTFYGKIWKNRR